MKIFAFFQTAPLTVRSCFFLVTTLIVLPSQSVLAESSLQQTLRECRAKLARGDNRFDTKVNGRALYFLFRFYQKNQNAKLRHNPVTGRAGAMIPNKNIALLIDYSLPSSKRRSYLIDMRDCELLQHDFVIHGGKHRAKVYRADLGRSITRWFRPGDPDNDGVLDYCQQKNGTRRYMTRPGFMLAQGCHMSAKKWPRVWGRCKGIKLIGLESRNRDVYRSAVVLHEHRLVYNRPRKQDIGQGCPAYAPGKLSDMVDKGLHKGTLVYIYAPQCSR